MPAKTDDLCLELSNGACQDELLICLFFLWPSIVSYNPELRATYLSFDFFNFAYLLQVFSEFVHFPVTVFLSTLNFFLFFIWGRGYKGLLDSRREWEKENENHDEEN